MVENADILGELFRSEVSKIESPMISLVRGRGLLNAIVIDNMNDKTAWDVCMKMKELGLLAKPTHGNIIRFAPPLVITREQILEGVEIIKKALDSFNV